MKRTKLTIRLILLSLIAFPCWIFSQEKGNATYYHRKFQGRHTSDGGRYLKDSLTCAHRTYPFGTMLQVRNPKNDKEVVVKVTDRGPHRKNLIIDLSYAAAKQLDIIRYGIAPVEITVLNPTPAIVPADTITAIHPQ